MGTFFSAITGELTSDLMGLSAQVFLQLVLLVALACRVDNDDFRGNVSLACHVFCRLALIPVVGSSMSVLFTSKDPILCLLASVGLLLQLLLTVNYELFYFNFSLRLEDMFSRNPKGLWIAASKLALTLLSCVQAATDHMVVFVLLLVMSIALGVLSARNSCISSSYHNPMLDKVQGVASAVYLVINFCYLFIYTLQNELIGRNELVMISVMLVFSLKFFLNFRNYKLKRVLSELSVGKFSNEQEADLYFKSYMNIFRQRDRKAQLYRSALLKTHLNTCTEVTCCCRIRNTLYDPIEKAYGDAKLQPHNDIVYFKHFLLKILEECLVQFKGSVLLTMCLGFFNLEMLGLYARATQIIKLLRMKAKKGQLSLPERFLVEQLFRQLMEVLSLKNKRLTHPIAIEHIQAFDLALHSLSKHVIEATSNFAEMWELTNEGTESALPLLAQNCSRNLKTVLDIEHEFY